ncbi:unnamed protein product, partial [Brassica napus]
FVSPSPPHRIFFLTTYTPFHLILHCLFSPTSFSSIIFFFTLVTEFVSFTFLFSVLLDKLRFDSHFINIK